MSENGIISKVLILLSCSGHPNNLTYPKIVTPVTIVRIQSRIITFNYKALVCNESHICTCINLEMIIHLIQDTPVLQRHDDTDHIREPMVSS